MALPRDVRHRRPHIPAPRGTRPEGRRGGCAAQSCLPTIHPRATTPSAGLHLTAMPGNSAPIVVGTLSDRTFRGLEFCQQLYATGTVLQLVHYENLASVVGRHRTRAHTADLG